MENHENKQLSEEKEDFTPGSTLAGRLVWALFGPCVFLSVIVPMWRNPDWFGIWEGIYLANIGLMLCGRYLEQSSGHGTTLYDEPSSWRHVKVYAMGLILTSLAVWMVIKLNH